LIIRPMVNYIVGPWHWTLNARLSNDIATLASGQSYGSYQTSWECAVPEIDIYQNWIRDDEGHIFGYVNCHAIDNDGYGHSDNHIVKFDVEPLAPENLEVTTSGQHPYLTWDANPEPDVQYYEIFRANGLYPLPSPPNFTKIAQTSNTAFTDMSITIGSGNNDYIAIYKIRAVDNAQQISDFSEEASLKYRGGGDSPEEIISLFGSNYPNPFNPTTTIRFALPQDQQVSLTVYSVTGERVAVLVNGYLEKGFHRVEWNGTNRWGVPVSSGIYLYVLLAGDTRLVGKMLLAK